jgi:hypothetical protein
MENNPPNEQNGAETSEKVLDNTIPPNTETKATTGKIEAIPYGKKQLLSGLQHPIEYLKFIDWISLPSSDRFPKTQKDLAVELGITEDTLSAWKNRDGFWDEVRSNVKSFWKGKLGEVTQALYLGMLQRKSASEFTAFMQYVDDWSPKTKVEGDGMYDTKKIEIEVFKRNVDEANKNNTDEDNESVRGNATGGDTLGS